MTTVFSETWTGSNGAAWPSQWTTSGTGTGSATIQSNAGRLVTNSDEQATASGMSAIADMELLVTVSFQNPKVNQLFVAAVRNNSTAGSAGWGGDFPTGSAYFIEADILNNTVQLYAAVSGAYTALGSAVSKTFTAGTAVWLRFRAQGSSVRWRIWNNGSSEPGTWDQTATDTSVTGPGKIGLAAESGTGTSYTVTFDSLTVDDLVTAAAGTFAAAATASAAGSVAVGAVASLNAATTATAGGTVTAMSSAAGQLTAVSTVTAAPTVTTVIPATAALTVTATAAVAGTVIGSARSSHGMTVVRIVTDGQTGAVPAADGQTSAAVTMTGSVATLISNGSGKAVTS